MQEGVSANGMPDCSAIVESLPRGIVVQDCEGRIVSSNAAAQKILGLRTDQLRGLSSMDPSWRAVHPDGSAFPGDTHPAMQTLRTGKAVHDVVMGLYNPDLGAQTWINICATPLRDGGDDGPLQGVYSVFEDITEKWTLENQLAEKDAEFRMAIQTAGDGFWVANLQGQLLEVNDAYARMSGYTREELLNLSIPDLDCFDRAEDVSARVQRLVQNGHDRFAVVHRAKGGRRWPAEVVASYSPMRGGRLFCFIKDLTEQQHSAELIWHQANFDQLTELPNRSLFFDRLSQECSAARRNGKLVALLFADLDGFKGVNDQFGHDAGDVVLQSVALRWQDCVRSTDTIARLGGDEFAIIVGNLDGPQEASAIAAKLIAALQQDIALSQGRVCRVGVSIGIALYPDNAVEMDSLLQAADQAMYVCKNGGKNSYAFSEKRSDGTPSGAHWIVFNEAHLIGVAAIDAQHRQLVRLVNELNQAISAGADDADRIAARFDELVRFTVFHFQTEHRFMEEHGYPDMAAHDYQHGQLIGELRLIVQKKSHEGDLLVLQRIKDWLLGHIQNADMPLGQYLVAQGLR